MASKAELKAIAADIKARQFAPVYYLYGAEEVRKAEIVRQLTDAAVDPATRDFNLEIRSGGDLDAETLGSLLATPPMMAERRVLVVRDVGALRKAARAELDRYMRSPAPDAVVILVTAVKDRDKEEKPDKDLLAGAKSAGVGAMKGDEIAPWVSNYLEREHSTRITERALALLQEAVGLDLAAIRVELDKLAAYSGGKEIDESAVSAIVGVRPEETVGGLLDAIADRDAATALARVDGALRSPKASAVGIVINLTAQTLGIGYARTLRDRGMPTGAVIKALYDLLKATSAFPGRAWGEAVNCWAGASSKWTLAQVDAALEALYDADLALKESRVSSDEQILAGVVLRICGAGARRAA